MFTCWERNIRMYHRIKVIRNNSPIFLRMNIQLSALTVLPGNALLPANIGWMLSQSKCYKHTSTCMDPYICANVHLAKKLRHTCWTQGDGGCRWMLCREYVEFHACCREICWPANDCLSKKWQLGSLTSARWQSRCTFIPILKVYVTRTACTAKWRPLKHNDYESIIIWRSTGDGPHPKCSPRRRIIRATHEQSH